MIELEPKNAAAYVSRGNAYQGTKMYSEAIEDCTKAIELDPKNANFYASRGLAYSLDKKYSESLTDCNRAIELNPMSSFAYLVRSGAYAGLGDFKKSRIDEVTHGILARKGL